MDESFMKERAILPLIASMALPAVVSMIVNSLYNIVDSLFVAMISEQAMTAKLDGADWRVYVIAGDGEIEEGQIWEAAMSAAQYKLDNLTLFIDHNGLQIDGSNEDVMDVMPIADKFRAFRWNILEIDGHDYDAIGAALYQAQAAKGKPTVIIAQTVKGKGVSFMENAVSWHGKAPTKEECERALRELGGEG